MFSLSFESAWDINNDAISMDKIHLQTPYGSSRNGELYRSQGHLNQVMNPYSLNLGMIERIMFC